jgi:hypothetical protein
MNTLIMILAILVLLGWVGYGVWRIIASFKKEEEIEGKKAGDRPENLREKNKSFDNYMDKLKQYELKPHERKDKADNGK